MKKCMLFTALVCACLVVYVNVMAQPDASPAPEGRAKTVVILPFYNYTGSDLVYLSEYIPELIKKHLDLSAGFTVYDAAEIRKYYKAQALSPVDLYNNTKAAEFLRSIKADIGVTGRYLIQDTTITIDIRSLEPASGDIIKGISFEGNLGDGFLGRLDKFAANRAVWIKEYVVRDTLLNSGSLVARVLSRIRQTEAGQILSNSWVVAILIFLGFYLISLVTVFIIDHIVMKIVERTETDVDDKIAVISRRPVKLIIIVLGMKFAVMSLALPSKLAQVLDNISISIIIIFIIYILVMSMDAAIRAWGKNVASRIDSRIDDDLVPLFTNASRVVIIIVGILTLLSRFDIDIAPLVASLGIAGFAIGFAVKDSLSNIIAGIILILDHSLAVGDKVMIDNDMGIITEVGLRNTKLMTFDNEVIVIPNSELMNKRFKNYVLPDPKIRVVVDFGVAYGTDIDEVERVVIDAIGTMSDICKEPEPAVLFIEMADFSLNMQAKFWVDSYIDQYGKKIEATKVIYNALNKAGIAIPFPTHTVYLENKQG